MRTKNIEENSIGTGDMFPDFNLPNTNDETVQLKELLKNGKVSVVFFVAVDVLIAIFN